MSINLTLLGQIITFIVFVWFTMRYVWPPITKAMQERQKRIAEGLDAADRGKRDLELAQHKALEVVREAKLQASQIVEQANKRAGQIVEEAKEQARREGEQLVSRAQSEIGLLAVQAREQLRQQVAGLAVQGAEKILHKEVDQRAHEQMLEQLVAELSS